MESSCPSGRSDSHTRWTNLRESGQAKNDPPNQERTPDRRTYEERTLEELRERAGELQLEGRSAMNKDELISALRQHSK
jgi:hypothetical protein